MSRLIIRYGMVGGIICVCLGLLSWFTIAPGLGQGLTQIIGYLISFFCLMSIPMGIKYYRDKLNNGVVSIPQALKIGLGISFITSFIVLCYSVLFFEFAGDDYLQWQAANLTEEELAEFKIRLEQMPGFMKTPLFQGLVIFGMVSLMGIIINFISTLFLQRPLNKKLTKIKK